MEPVKLWAAVDFTARSGSTEALLTAAARAGLHLYGVTALPGGFCGHCAARQYPRLAALARRYRVRLRVRKKQGLYFRVRPLLRRAGLWAGLAVFLPLLLWTQQFVWFADVSTLTAGQAARASAVLRQVSLQPGSAVTEAKLAAGEYALLHSGEFSWASLNFAKGRLEVEAAAAKPKPDITAGTLHGIRARCSGTVVRTNLVSGTMLVMPGQQVEAGQGLIGTARSERDGTLIFAPAAGTVLAQFEWNDTRHRTAGRECLSVHRRLYPQHRAFGVRAGICPACRVCAGKRRSHRPALPAGAAFAWPCAPLLHPGDLPVRAAAGNALPHRGAGGGTGPAAEPAGFVRRMAGCGAHCPQRGLHCERRQAELHRDVYDHCGYLRVRCKKGLPISGKALLHFASYLFSAACASYSASRSFRSY